MPHNKAANTSVLLEETATISVCEVSDKLHKTQRDYDDGACNGRHQRRDEQSANKDISTIKAIVDTENESHGCNIILNTARSFRILWHGEFTQNVVKQFN